MKGILCLVSLVFSASSHEPWTSTYRYTNQRHARLPAIVPTLFGKDLVPAFNQLICSWNCRLPMQGYFSFFVQVSDEKTGKWSEWVHIADWGRNVKKTRLHKSDSLDYHYVRLELGTGLANGFRVKVTKNDGCDSSCDSLAVCVSNLNKMVPDQQGDRHGSCFISRVPFLSQFHIDHPKNDALCSPTSCTMLLRHHLGTEFDPALVAEAVYDEGLGIYGSWPCNMAAVYALSGGQLNSCVTRLDNFTTLHRYLMREIPVCVSVRGPLAGSATPYASGHILVVIGFDAQTQEVICNDPAFEYQEAHGTRYALVDFLKAWERSKRLTYLIIPPGKMNKLK